ncbi:MAG: radical SAM protein [Candidatus Nomurabacteria bacterium]|jgi:lysine 2,3-aminomutase|nr:radical SAM protein [Candidatus Nomurabacteria bacterium]
MLIDSGLKKDYERLVETESVLPIKVSDFYLKKVNDEIEHIGTGGPLYRSVLPTKERITLKADHETRDYVEEDKHLPINGVDYIMQKYDDRVLEMITDTCFAHCQYCFRTYNLARFQNSNSKETIKNKVSVLKEYLSKNKKISEVILSGGDPLSIGYDNLSCALRGLKDYNTRIHTRAIVYQPEVFSEETIDLLKENDTRLVFHINHPYEICDVVEEKIRLLGKSGIRLYSQFPLLRGINDNHVVLNQLLSRMDDLRIRPLSIFIPDPISYGASFRVNFKRVVQIMNDLNWSTPSWVNSTRFVMDTTIGKVRHENIKEWDGDCIIFARDGKEVKYYDINEALDAPSDIETLLWRDNL